jgi:hypothetical protein
MFLLNLPRCRPATPGIRQQLEVAGVMRQEDPVLLCGTEQMGVIVGALQAQLPDGDNVVTTRSESCRNLARDIVIDIQISHEAAGYDGNGPSFSASRPSITSLCCR